MIQGFFYEPMLVETTSPPVGSLEGLVLRDRRNLATSLCLNDNISTKDFNNFLILFNEDNPFDVRHMAHFVFDLRFYLSYVHFRKTSIYNNVPGLAGGTLESVLNRALAVTVEAL